MELIQAVGFSAVKLLWEAAQASMNLEIHNRCLGVELIDPLYFSDGAVCHMPLDQKVTTGGTLDTVFKINLNRLAYEGALICRLRKKGTNPDQQSDTDTTNIDKNWSNHVQLLVGWKLERFKEPRVYMLLVEHGEKLVWDKDKLSEQHNEFRGRLNAHHGSIESTWLMEDNSVLRLALDGVGNREYGIKITISEANQGDHTSVPIWIEPKV
jgi:hypothetical protein